MNIKKHQREDSKSKVPSKGDFYNILWNKEQVKNSFSIDDSGFREINFSLAFFVVPHTGAVTASMHPMNRSKKILNLKKYLTILLCLNDIHWFKKETNF